MVKSWFPSFPLALIFPFKLLVKIENRSVRERARSRKNPNYAAAATGRQSWAGVSELEHFCFSINFKSIRNGVN